MSAFMAAFLSLSSLRNELDLDSRKPMQRKFCPARLLKLENEGCTTEEETDTILYISVVFVMMLTSSVSCVHLSLVSDPLC